MDKTRPSPQTKPSDQAPRPSPQTRPSDQGLRPDPQTSPSDQALRPDPQTKPSDQALRRTPTPCREKRHTSVLKEVLMANALVDDVLSKAWAAAEVVDVKVIEEDSVDNSERRKFPPLYTDAEISTLDFRFSVGDVVSCTVDEGVLEGVVVQRCYREGEWPAGYYAAVRAADSIADRTLSLLAYR
eukprot:2088611-Prymnesium_polylepis.2